MQVNRRLTFVTITLVFGLVTLAVIFQNCSKVRFENHSSNDLSKTEVNGTGYDGKPDGTYYRFVPEYTCEGQESFAASVAFLGSNISFTENQKLLCKAIQNSLDPNLIDISIYQNEVIGYQEGIYEGRSAEPTKIPANLVEVWCKDSNDESGIETLTHFDRTSGTAINRIYYHATGQHRMVPDAPVARLIMPNEVIVKNENDFELHVYRDKPGPKLGLFLGNLQATIDGQKVNRETFCRLGGSLDPRIWPVKQVVDINIKHSTLKMAADHSHFVFEDHSSILGTNDLFLASTDGQKLLRVNSASGSHFYFDFSGDSKSLIHTSSTTAPIDPGALYQMSLDSFANTKISMLSWPYMHDYSSRLRVNAESTPTHFSILKDSPYLVYYEVQALPDGTYTPVLKSSLNGVNVLLHPPLSWPNPADIKHHYMAHSLGKVAYISQIQGSDSTYVSRIYSVNMDGTGLLDVTPNANWNWNSIGNTENFRTVIPQGSRYILTGLPQLNMDITVAKYAMPRYFAVALDGSGSRELLAAGNLLYEGPSSAVFTSNQDLTKKVLIQYATGITQELNPNLTDLLFSRDGSLIALSTGSDGLKQVMRISTQGNSTTDLCPGTKGNQMLIQEMSENRFVLAVFHETSFTTSVYSISPSSGCTKVNSFPMSGTLRALNISPDSWKILIRSGSVKANSEQNSQLHLVPLNGRPAIKVNAPIHSNSRIWHHWFSADSRNVVFVGDQIIPLRENAYTWPIPLSEP